MDRMNAIVGDGRSTRLATVPAPARPPRWARVEVLLAGICRTDVHAAEGRLPLRAPTILGHELVGVVEEAEPTSGLAPGDRVSASPLLACGQCAECARARRCRAPRMLGVDRDGAFAERIVLPEACLVRVPPDLPLRRAAYVEPIAAALAVTRAPIRAAQRGTVVGRGRIAELTRRVLRARGFAIDDDARDALDFAVEASGTEDGLDAALDGVLPGGVVVLKSRPERPLPLDVARVVRNDVTLAGVSYGSFDEAVSLARELAIDDLLGDVFPLDRFDAAMARTREDPLGPKLFLSPRGEA